MLKTISRLGLAAAIAVTPAVALAQTGTSSSYGSYGSGPQIPTQSLTPFDRSWNHFNESKDRAIAGSASILRHDGVEHNDRHRRNQ